MEFAIVDIETTGGHAAANSITEVSIQVYDGEKVVQRFETLINPQTKIPLYITGLTGITDKMVAKAPRFEEVAEKIYTLLNNRIFVAHAVNFDYSFLKKELSACGFNLNAKKLCTVRLSRKAFPGLPSYSLGNLCSALGIEIKNRHRAGGDAEATVVLFEKIWRAHSESIFQFLKQGSREQALPPHLPKEQFDNLPGTPGVYFFHNNKGKVVYVGKAKNIKKRVSSHFSNNSPQKQKQDFMRHIHNISYRECGSELMSLLLESHEIKRLWPEFNRSQKRFEPTYGLVSYTDQRGFYRIALEKVKPNAAAVLRCSTMLEGLSILNECIKKHNLCPRLCSIATNEAQCRHNKCLCLKKDKRSITRYNKRITKALEKLTTGENYTLLETGRTDDEVGCVVVENGIFTRMGFVPKTSAANGLVPKEVLETLPLYRENFSIRQIIRSYSMQENKGRYC